jgi:hypothetical protein
MIEGLLVERGWPVGRLRRHLQALLRATFVTGGGDRQVGIVPARAPGAS